ncbi:cyclic beta 1-2 glucan synthetase [Pantoea alhagi]|uniref:GH36-type glycosyl hydrolase domain-containing protein n=1 Tax=Pantoea alhagi TaxID=1891675 RepID=UPI00202AD888|nr:glucoamylase family protein [Pantoea alhagi]URQ60995.1 cyclic beta 1-2 glucan synthetase [Pantoea alhagi]
MKVNFDRWFNSADLPPGMLTAEHSAATDRDMFNVMKPEIFSEAQMTSYGTKLANAHQPFVGKSSFNLPERLAKNEQQLIRCAAILSEGDKKSLTPAGLWVLDNFYLIEEQIRLVRQLLPAKFGQGLPGLAGPYQCLRIQAIANEMVKHSDGRLESNILFNLLHAYQQVTPLLLGELWALTATLRFALIDNLARIAMEVAQAHQERIKADKWISEIIATAGHDSANVILVVAEMAKQTPVLSGAFVAELSRRLNGQSNLLALTWVEQQLQAIGLTSARVIAHFNQQLAISQLSVSNSIAGLRQLGEINWPDMVESLSLVEQTLRQDPANIYCLMHFDSRDHYRHVIEMLARHSRFSEKEVAEQVLALARNAVGSARRQHVGYFLIDKGRPQLEERLNSRFTLLSRMRNRLSQRPLLSWLGSLALVTTALIAETLVQTHSAGLSLLLWTLLPLVIVTSQLALQLLSEITTRIRHPEPLASMNYAEAIPAEQSTLVVIPCLLTSQNDIDALLRSLEVCYLGNATPHLYFALLTDFTDSEDESSPKDQALLHYAIAKTEALNRRYPPLIDHAALFSLLHRDRLQNNAQGVWMGYERKRGKIDALNRWLRNEQDIFSVTVGAAQSALNQVKYVITLDSDTILPRETAHKLIGVMAHPFNTPRFDEKLQRVVEGYAILQPRMAEEIPLNGQSRYAKLSSGVAGNDPYSSIASDLYQDLFGEGSFIGKGIYEVDAFSRATRNTCPENLVLSHDLLEGCYARAGVVSNIVLYEQYPAHYFADVARRFRWVRGDWQLLNWLRLRVRLQDGQQQNNPLSMLSRWKLFDNLRRSLVAPSLLVLLFVTLTAMPNPVYWCGLIALVLLLPGLLALLMDSVNKGKQHAWQQHLKIVAAGSLSRLCRAGLYLATLPYESYWSLKAIVLTLWRLNVSHRYLHEWKSSGASQTKSEMTSRDYYREMWVNPLAGALLIALTTVLSPSLFLLALAIGLLWIIVPQLIKSISQPGAASAVNLSPQQQRLLRQTGRETWAFFEEFAGEKENWLPPDNMQEIPEPIIAHRTSPTNIGLSLLANLTAWDFGYLTQGAVLSRTTATLDTLDRMEHFRGHLYNWYDTRTLAPLNPRYVSSVDSGNLAGHLVTLQAGLAIWKNEPVIAVHTLLAGLDDTLQLAEKHLTPKEGGELAALRNRFATLSELPFAQLLIALNELLTLSAALTQRSAEDNPVGVKWLNAFHRQLSAFSEEWQRFFAWGTPAGATADNLPSLVWLAELNRHCPELAWETAEPVMWEARQRLGVLSELDKRLDAHQKMDFRFLYHAGTALISVGYNCESGQLDSGKYDLFPSEIRLTHYIAISTSQLPVKSWYALGRLFTQLDKQPAVMSWSGSMFEYLMPQLVMPVYPNTLTQQMARSAVERQIAWGEALEIPWGVSESGYVAFDANHNYQYKAFGIAELGLKRGLNEERVVAPYATMLALMVMPQEAIANLATLEKWGAKGEYGFYEALDFTPSRLARGQQCARVSSYMAHHQGMGFLAISHLLLQAPMVQRFMSSALLLSSRFLLQEKMPDAVELYTPRRQFDDPIDNSLAEVNADLRQFNGADTLIPQVQLLSNAHYHLMVTQAGSGYSIWKGLALTRWRSDATSDNRGAFCYIHDTQTGEVIGNAYQPCVKNGPRYQTVFNDAGAEFNCRDGATSIHTHVVVSPEDDVEIRRMTLTHRGRLPRSIEITTYSEVVLAPAANDMAHPAFSNLFVQTEIMRHVEGILAHRRPRDEQEKTPWMFHAVAIHGEVERETCYETDRARFLGRGNTSANPQVFQQHNMLSGSDGSVLDPVLSISQRVTLQPGVPLVVDLLYGVTMQRDHSLGLIEKYRNHINVNRVFEMVWSHSQVALRQLNIRTEDASLFNTLASAIIFPCAEMRGESKTIQQNRRGQAALWGHSLSGDLPIVLLIIDDAAQLPMLEALIQAHNYWRHKGLHVDLVVLNNDRGGYQQALHHQIMSQVAAGEEYARADKPGGIFIRKGESFSAEDYQLLQAIAVVVLEGKRGNLAEQTEILLKPAKHLPAATFTPERSTAVANVVYATEHLQFFNGIGGFTPQGEEYQIVLQDGQTTPAPWSNVLANRDFGSVISESGQAYSWFGNAHEYRLTPWENDPVSDSAGEAFYLRDEESGHYWSPMPLPMRGEGSYRTRHGFGYSVFDHSERGIVSSMTVFVAEEAPVKLALLTVSNHSGRNKTLSVTGYVEWILGELRSKSAMHVITEPAQFAQGMAMLANNYYSSGGSTRTAFFASSGSNGSYSGDRSECLGRNGTLRQPEMMTIRGLSGASGVGLDPCATLQRLFSLIDGDSQTFVFALGVGDDRAAAETLIERFLDVSKAETELASVIQHWRGLLHKIEIDTPDSAANMLANGWLLYQTLASRLLARSGYYQSGGAFGFRDQLQDTLALVHSAPERTRAQILLCASRQFVEGDVQHWWHPPGGNGVRTRCSDDYLWLPFAICHYVESSNDLNVLAEPAGYLQARRPGDSEESVYEQPTLSPLTETLWQHGVRAIKYGLSYGPHGLPLIGTGDWNDGMNHVGAAGKGESIWLGFFLYTVLDRYAALAERLGEQEVVTLCRTHAAQLKINLNQAGWDGEWFLRGFFDNGKPLGSHLNSECRIDAIAQSWAVLSTAGEPDQCVTAMESLWQNLVDKDLKIIKLLTPPFNGDGPNPGYIRGYVPGVRENGGQYTHGAIWAVMAFAKMGDIERAWALLALINPINHSLNASERDLYKVEPYVMAADVYAAPPHGGRGGWSWYTGSAGWMYQLIIATLLGITRQGDRLLLQPRLPAKWPEISVRYREGESLYEIRVMNAGKVYQIWLDDERCINNHIPLIGDGKVHQVRIELGPQHAN